jgi:type II secretory pathway pseudopilin PulG
VKTNAAASRFNGFTLLELLVSTAIFMVICGAMFGLLQISQQKYVAETQMSGAFQEARLGLDQIVRDINSAGYPPPSMFSNLSNPLNYAAAPVAWYPNYPSTDCQIGTNCSTPTDQDLIIETNTGSGMVWIRYQFNPAQGVLYRGVVPKTTGDPLSAFTGAGIMTPLVNNVLNYPNALTAPNAPTLAQINIDYPTMLPAGSQSMFVYSCNTPTGSQLCSGAFNAPRFIADIDVTLIVQTPQPDAQTHGLKLIELTGRGHQTNSGN